MNRIIPLILFLLAAAPARATFTLNVSTAGPATPLAVVTSTPSGIVCPGACSASFVAGTTVTLGAVWPSTEAFVAWGGPQGCRSNFPTCRVLMSGGASVTATFNPLLSLAFAGPGIGVVTSTGVNAAAAALYGSGAAQTFVYPTGATVVLHASTRTASSFSGWSGDPGCGAFSTCTVTMNGYEAIVATFTADGVGPYPLAVTVPNGGGTVTSTPPGILTGAGVFVSTFPANGVVHLATAAARGYRFGGWANGGCARLTPCVVQSTSPLQGLGGKDSPAAYFFKTP